MAGEVVKARKNLSELKEEIVTVSKELGTLREEVTSLNTEKATLVREIETLKGEIKNLLRQIADRLAELRRLGVNIEDTNGVAGKLDIILEEAETRWKELEDKFDERTTTLNHLNEEIEKKEKVLGERQGVADTLEREISQLLSDKVEATTLLEKAREGARKANEKRQQIMATIHDALTRFKVFERRIAQFSKDTGYIVGYPRPEKLLEDNNDIHETGVQQ